MAMGYEIVRANGLTFLVDEQKPKLKEGESAVYQYHDEATELLRMAKEVRRLVKGNFSAVVDPFCGGGHTGLPIIKAGIASALAGSDINPRAIELANINAQINGLDDVSEFRVADITKDPLPDTDGRSLIIANAPFALKVRGADLDIMRNGGENGLALLNIFLQRAMEASKPGDVIIGLSQSRIAVGKGSGEPEVAGLIFVATESYRPQHGYLRLLEGRPMWRSYSGVKEQPNPMNLSMLYKKANPEDPEEIEAYKTGSRFHLDQGYDRFGYYEYAILR